ncbi:MAG: hypothetical protein IJJ29_09880 [Solobacterium sp.]|nr:hypothetical protein [Solobacterium sp.]
MSKIRRDFSRYWLITVCVCFFLLFALISRWAPVAGDDWGYALGGMWNNPLVKAIEFYRIWSGRFFSELWGFCVAPHKKLWNILNPMIFTGVLWMLMAHSGREKHPYLIPPLAVMLILTVPNGLRKQTYAWIMGTTYVLPLLFFLIYLYCLRKIIFHDDNNRYRKIFAGSLCLAVPLYMENAAAMLVGVNVLVCIWLYFNKRDKLKLMAVYTVISIIGTLLIRYAPGAVYRMARDHEEFRSLSLFGKIAVNWSQFILYTYTNNSVLTSVMSLCLLILVLKQKRTTVSVTLAVIFAWGILQGISPWLYEVTGAGFFQMLSDLSQEGSLLINTVMYMLYTFALFAAVLLYIRDTEKKWVIVLVLFAAGGANAVMLISPIFDVRSSIYTVYMFILFTLFLAEEITFPDLAEKGIVVLCSAVCILRAFGYYDMYHLVHLIEIKRNSQLAWYQVRPDAKDVYILGYPIDWIHSADVVEGDTYHEEYFKKYYYLAEDVTLRFYYLPEYTEEAILNG